MRIVIADDSVLLREGMTRLLAEAGFDVVATAGDADALLRLVALDRPQVAVVDIRMPPTHTDEGLVAADHIRTFFPDVGVLVLSQYMESRYAMRLLEKHTGGIGYLLKDRVSDVAVLADAIRRVGEGECVLDPTIVDRLMQRRRTPGGISDLTDREKQVLALMAEGRSNYAISTSLTLSPKTVESHISRILAKLGIAEESVRDHRRVLAVLAYLKN